MKDFSLKTLLHTLLEKNKNVHSVKKENSSTNAIDEERRISPTPVEKRIQNEDSTLTIINKLLHINEIILYNDLPRIAYQLQKVQTQIERKEGRPFSVIIKFNQLRRNLEQSIHIEEQKLFPIFYRWKTINKEEHNICNILNETLKSRKNPLFYMDNLICFLRDKARQTESDQLNVIITKLDKIQENCLFKETEALPLIIKKVLNEMGNEYYHEDAFQELYKNYSSIHPYQIRNLG